MRKVADSYMVRIGGKWERIPFDEGSFHCWGIQSESLDVGAMVDTVGIVELPDGRIVTPAPGDILFLDKKGCCHNE